MYTGACWCDKACIEYDDCCEDYLTLCEDAPTSVVRAGFKQPPANEEEFTSVFMKLFQEAYERQNGFMK